MKILISVLFASAMLYSCTTTQQNLYSWYDSENASYQYTKRMTEETLKRAMAQYELVVNQQKGSRLVTPPGMSAEYGFLLYKAGRREEGLTLLKQEIKLYPESEKYISRIIKQLTE